MARKILGISWIAILKNLDIFFDNMSIILQEKTKQLRSDGVHYIVSSALCSIHLVKIFIF